MVLRGNCANSQYTVIDMWFGQVSNRNGGFGQHLVDLRSCRNDGVCVVQDG